MKQWSYGDLYYAWLILCFTQVWWWALSGNNCRTKIAMRGKQCSVKFEYLVVNNSLMSPLVPQFFRSHWVLFPAVPLFSLSSFFCLNIAVIFLPVARSAVSLSNHLSVSCGAALIAIALAWLGLSTRSGSCLCGHSPTALAIHNLYTCAATHTHADTHSMCHTQHTLPRGYTRL